MATKSTKLSRATRWSGACQRAVEALGELTELQQEFSDWKDNLPENLQSGTLYEKLEDVTNLDFESALDTVQEAEGLDLPRGFGRD